MAQTAGGAWSRGTFVCMCPDQSWQRSVATPAAERSGGCQLTLQSQSHKELGRLTWRQPPLALEGQIGTRDWTSARQAWPFKGSGTPARSVCMCEGCEADWDFHTEFRALPVRPHPVACVESI
eukprot:361612-Chlamydomonas_euryale.AAC.3